MKILWYYFVKIYMTIGFTFFYKKVSIQFIEGIPKNKAILFVSNHQNALIDPLLIGISNPRELYFLTRAKVFGNNFIKAILNSINMLPIYRIRDGIDTLSKNEKIFQKCYQLLQQNKTVLIFPEGNHNLKRRVRILSKGFTRIAFGALEKHPNMELVIIPIGLNYSNPKSYASKVHIQYGKQIDVKYYWKLADKNKAVVALKDEVRSQLKKLTTHIEDLEDYQTIENHFNKNDFLYPEKVNARIASQTKFPPFTNKNQKGFKLFYNLMKINSIFPLLIWKKIQPKIAEEEYLATFKFTIGITAVPIFYVLQALIISIIFGTQAGVIYLFFSILLAFLSVKTK